jgi:hypothetical protein
MERGEVVMLRIKQQWKEVRGINYIEVLMK